MISRSEGKIIFGPEIWNSQVRGGISRYFEEVITFLIDRPNQELSIEIWAYPNSRNESLRRLRERTEIHVPDFERLTSRDTYHATYFEYESMSKLRNFSGTFVVTVFDMISEIFPNFRWRFWRNVKRNFIFRADVLICISQTTKRDLLRFYPTVQGRITCIYLGSSSISASKETYKTASSETSFVYIGNRHGYKNFKLLMEALEGTNYPLTVVGGEVWTKDEIQFMKSKNINNQIQRVILEDHDLWELLKSSTALVCTSKYEGFSLPVLEALTLGSPAICSEIDVHREIYRDSPSYFSVGNSDDLRTKLDLHLNSTYSTNAHRLHMNNFLSELTWDNCARNHLDIYTRCQEK